LLQTTKVGVIAEGIESDFQAAALRAAGVPMAQGFYFSPPISAEELKAYYSRTNGEPCEATHWV
jgi:EAL domain-containing protein (putative c-di-GMP-specific phosphodiesterase class I)